MEFFLAGNGGGFDKGAEFDDQHEREKGLLPRLSFEDKQAWILSILVVRL